MQLNDQANYRTKWVIRKFADDAAFAANQPFDESEIDGNLLLNEGIGEALDLICGLGSPTAFDNTNAQLGVGTSTTAAAATQTDLLTGGVWKGMEATYPQRSGQTITFRSVFGSADANQAWQEFSVRNGATADKNLNRKVSDQGTKAVGQTWTLDLQITLA